MKKHTKPPLSSNLCAVALPPKFLFLPIATLELRGRENVFGAFLKDKVSLYAFLEILDRKEIFDLQKKIFVNPCSFTWMREFPQYKQLSAPLLGGREKPLWYTNTCHTLASNLNNSGYL